VSRISSNQEIFPIKFRELTVAQAHRQAIEVCRSLPAEARIVSGLHAVSYHADDDTAKVLADLSSIKQSCSFVGHYGGVMIRWVCSSSEWSL